MLPQPRLTQFRTSVFLPKLMLICLAAVTCRTRASQFCEAPSSSECQPNRASTWEDSQIREALKAKKAELAAARRANAILSGGAQGRKSNAAWPVTDGRGDLNQVIVDARENRLQAQLRVEAMTKALQSEDAFCEAVPDRWIEELGELLLPCPSSQVPAITVKRLKQHLLETKAKLPRLSRFYTESHPQVRRIHQQIQVTEKYLEELRTKVKNSILRNPELARMLMHMARLELDRAVAREKSLSEQCQRARQEALPPPDALERKQVLQRDVANLQARCRVLQKRMRH